MNSKVKPPLLLALVVVGLALAPPSQAQPVCLGFGPPPAAGTTYGAPVGQSSGDLAFSLNGIDVYVYNFSVLPFGTAFNRAYHTNAPVVFSPGQSIRTNNINLLFDFRNVGFTVRRVTFYYLDLGGYENLAVNGAMHVGELTSAPAMLGGTTVAVTSSPTSPIQGKRGTVTITGPLVKTVMVGGQELWIDSVCASP
jgi:hypothetical protein